MKGYSRRYGMNDNWRVVNEDLIKFIVKKPDPNSVLGQKGYFISVSDTDSLTPDPNPAF
jgi:hypothetical protein